MGVIDTKLSLIFVVWKAMQKLCSILGIKNFMAKNTAY